MSMESLILESQVWEDQVVEKLTKGSWTFVQAISNGILALLL